MLFRQIVCLQSRFCETKVHFRLIHLSQKYSQTTNHSAFTLTKRNKKDRIDAGALFLLIIPISTFALGCWQVQRRKWKINLIETLKTRTQAEPISLLENLDRLPDFEYNPVRVRGRFDHSREFLIEPRSRFDEQSNTKHSMTTATVGAHVITPFRVANRNYDILVNRGFVPMEFRDPATRRAGQIEGEREIIGLLRSTDYSNGMWTKNDPANNIWRTRDIEEMSAAMKTAPIFLDEIKSSSVPGGPIGGQTNVQLRNEHLSYILTWFSLSALTTVMWIRKYLL